MTNTTTSSTITSTTNDDTIGTGNETDDAPSVSSFVTGSTEGSASTNTAINLTSATAATGLITSTQLPSNQATVGRATVVNENISLYVGLGIVAALALLVILAGICLRRCKTRRSSGRERLSNSKRDIVNVSQHVAQSSVYSSAYTNRSFQPTSDEMGEKPNDAREPASDDACNESNSLRNKEENWIIPVEELPEGDIDKNFDTTQF